MSLNPKKPLHCVTVPQLAQSLNVTARRVHQLVREGMPKAERGRYDLTACLEWYVRYLQRAVERRESLNSNGTSDAVRRERTRLLQAQAERAERENRVASGELVPIADFTHAMSSMVLHARQRLLQLPGRVAPQLEGETHPAIKAKLTREVHAALTALASRVPAEHDKRNPCGQRFDATTSGVANVAQSPHD